LLLGFFIFSDILRTFAVPKTRLNDALSCMKNIIIAIDGPAASGKSTTAKRVADILHYTYIDTGAMFRAVALKILDNHFEDRVFSDPEFLEKVLRNTEIILDRSQVLLDGIDVSERIRSNDVSNFVSRISALKPVRYHLAHCQRLLGKKKSVVMDGRDIGTAIFPEAELKIFMTARVSARAKRRHTELAAKGVKVGLEQLEEEIADRDYQDSHREIAPLRQHQDAIVLDTSDISIDEQVDFILHHARKIIST
jgi:cytidylate kinase